MYTILAWAIGGWELAVILFLILLLFGAKKIPELARGLGRGISEFKNATKEIKEDIEQSAEEDKTPSKNKKK